MQTYSEGSVSGLWSGGLIGKNAGSISESYSTGRVSGTAYKGGLIGYDDSVEGSVTSTYWNTTTSGITNLSQGAGNIANDPGIAGLTTKEFRSGLPGGFSNKMWREKRKINGGLPYLSTNPPT
jgi:hypothetical protein